MVGVIVIGLIGGVIAATVFAVIPWAQDGAAKHQLESIHTAENAYMGFSSSSLDSLPAGAAPNSFAASADLEVAGLLTQNKNYCAAISADSKTYYAYSLSATGKIWTSSKNSKPVVFSGTLPDACPDLITAATTAGSTTSDGTTTYSYTADGSAKEDISSPGTGDGTTSAKLGTLTGDGSGSYFPKNTSWLGAYGPVMSNTLSSPTLDLGGWTYDRNSRSIGVTFKTDGKFTGVGGSWNYMAHYDISCYDTNTKTYKVLSGGFVGILKGPYTSQPGPNSATSWINCGSGAPATMLPSQVLIRQATDAEWAGYSLGYRSYAYTMPGLSEGWINSEVPQQ